MGPNSIPTKILKEFKGILKLPLTMIINISFQTRIFPSQCKLVHMTTTFKKGNKLDTLNYRSFLFLSNISKVFDKAMYA